MKKQTFGFGALVGGLITAPMIALMYFAQKWQDLSFAPFDVFDWIARALPGPLVTFGIDLMIEILITLGASVAGTAKTAEQVMAVMLFFAGGLVATIVMFAILRRYGNQRKEAVGLIAGALLGIPIAYITASMGQSSVNAVVNFVWVFLLFVTWGNLVSYSAPRLLPRLRSGARGRRPRGGALRRGAGQAQVPHTHGTGDRDHHRGGRRTGTLARRSGAGTERRPTWRRSTSRRPECRCRRP